MPDHVILAAETHRDLRIRTDHAADTIDPAMSCITVLTEFRRVQNEYPILFRLNQESGEFTALALFGFENGENLFLDNDRWDARYRPLAIDIQPFLIGRHRDESDVRQVHIDMASTRVGHNDGVRVFDEHDRPTPFLERVIGQLRVLDEGYVASADFFAALHRYDLLEPLTLEITLDDGSTNRLVGFHVIDEERLAALDEAALGDLHEAGYLMPMFMALASLGNIGDLVARKNRRGRHG